MAVTTVVTWDRMKKHRQTLTILLILLFLTQAHAAQRIGPIVINEFVASNRASLLDGENRSSDWIELYNSARTSTSLTGWSLTDTPDDLQKWTFPANTVIGPGDYLLIFASGRSWDDPIDPKGYLHTNFSLSKKGEYLALVNTEGEIVQAFSPAYPAQYPDLSYGLWQDQGSFFAVATPGYANDQPFPGFTDPTLHNVRRGFYHQPFTLTITCATPEATIYYTLDGSEPTQETGLIYDRSLPIPIVTTTQVRSVAVKPGWRSARISTHSYIFVDHVAQQPTDPPGWPSDWGYSSDAKAVVPADYQMDPRVVNSTLPNYSVPEALLDIPTVSISMLPDDFISDSTGIYANPQSRWERKCSVEYLLPNGGPGFQEDCKIEIHGNASRRPYRMQKHSLRLTFTSQYGSAKLNTPLFPDSTVQEFNQLVLRACFTDSWGLVSWSPSRYRPNDSQYLRDVWMKDSLRAMGQPSSHSNFVHVYVNGLYFGLHNLTERVGEDFFASHLGGQPEDWEVNEDLTSPDTRWQAMMAINPSTPAGYVRIQDYLDIDNFIDYMLLHFYADAEDWPHHNGYAAANAISGDGRYRFFVWDQEIVLDYHGRAASRINSNRGVGALFQKMRTSEEFRLRFADRVHKHCFNQGALSVTASQERYRDLAQRIDKAIVAESARWGDTQISTPYGNSIGQPTPLNNVNHNLYPPAPHGPATFFTREDSWIVERDNIIENYIPAIYDTANSYALVNVLRDAELYPRIEPPLFFINALPDHGGLIRSGDTLILAHPNEKGVLYYTLDGTDPRLPEMAESVTSQILVSESAVKKVWIPTRDMGQTWTGSAKPFDDSAWIHGTPRTRGRSGAVGYERSNTYQSYIAYDVESDMYGSNEACYLRIRFTVDPEDLVGFNYLALRMRYDDGFVAYLNGQRMASANARANPAWNEGATTSHDDSSAINFQTFDCSGALALLQPGDNILAIHGMNYRVSSTDFLISVELIADEDTAAQAISPTALVFLEPLTLTESMQIKARIRDQGQWSALSEATYTLTPNQ
jgi:hypothetical protein